MSKFVLQVKGYRVGQSNSLMKVISAFVLYIVCIVVTAVAQPNGQFTIAINSPVYDVSGTHFGYEQDTDVRFDVFQQANGVLTGQAVAEYDDGFLNISGVGPVNGRVTGNAIEQRASFKFRALVSGQDIYGWYYRGSYSWTGYGVHNALTGGVFLGSGSATGCIQGDGCRRERVSIEVEANGGAWELNINVATEGSIVTGAAIAQHWTGRTFSYLVRGRYSAKTGRSVLSLTGTGDGYGSKLNVMATGNLTVIRVTGKLLGQAVNDLRQ